MDRLSGISQGTQPETDSSSSDSEGEEEQGATGIDMNLYNTPKLIGFSTEVIDRNHREEYSHRREEDRHRYNNRRYRKKKEREEKIQEEKNDMQ